MNKPDKTILKPDAKRSTASLPRSTPMPNKIANFKFPAIVSPELKTKYQMRKVNLISRKKLINRLTHRPEDDFIGTLKLW